MSVRIVEERRTGQPGGFAFVVMSTQWEGRGVVSMVNRKSFMGKELLVKETRATRGVRGER
jgi:RNA recognition motif-containing protein